jgi:predicted phage terminase large subunit-like protein
MDAERNIYVLDCVRGQWLTDDRNRQMLLTANLDGRTVRVRIPQDPGQAGVDQVAALTRLLSGFRVKAARPSGDKETRADSFASQVNAGNVYLVRGQWNTSFIEELRAFPLGKNDDIVDAASDAFTEITRGGVGVHL